MEELNQLYFDNLYNSNYQQVDEIYNIFISIIENEDKTKTKDLLNDFFKNYNKKNMS